MLGSGETFRLVLSNPVGAELADAEATGTILNTDESVSEGSNDLPANTSTDGVVAVGGSAIAEAFFAYTSGATCLHRKTLPVSGILLCG